MDDGEFQWDDRKATDNVAKHNISFEVAKLVFEDPFIFEWEDDRHSQDEQRFSAVGSVEGTILYVAFTFRESSIRIISARRAVPFERRKYYEQSQI
jgi:uncharacterized protein